MEPNRIGRMLGIGARVAGTKLREQADRLGTPAQPSEAGAGVAAPGRAQETGARIGAGVKQAARNFRAAQAESGSTRAVAGTGNLQTAIAADAASGTRRLARGAAHFGTALFRPFIHATSLLWNQIAGIFFALFGLFFLEHAWMVYQAAHWRDRHVFLYGALAVVFGWFAVSTFWRVRHKQRRG
jgi:hypothetical protein